MAALPALAAAAAGAGAAVEPGVAALAPVGAESFAPAPLATAEAPAVALDPEAIDDGLGAVESEPHATRLPVTGRRPSMRPVSVAITPFGIAWRSASRAAAPS